jgi:hypothetical protein
LSRYTERLLILLMTKYIQILIYSFSLSISIPSFARDVIAKVIKAHGKVSKLIQGEKEATKVNIGDTLYRYTSLVTQASSFVKVQFNDQSTLSLGPNGMLVLNEFKLGSPGFVTLLKGNLRTKVKKNKNLEKAKNKFYVRTRSAAMGVRGTEFQAMYNPDNRVTSLLTYKGEVAMTDFDLNQPLEKYQKPKYRQEVVRKNGKVEVRNVELATTEGPNTASEQLEHALDMNEAVVVKKGQYSGTVHSLKRTSLPVKINPVQYRALYQNQELKDKFLKKNVFVASGRDVLKEKSPVNLAPQKAPLEGYFNPKTKEFAPKAGGYLDFSTGLYVPPEETAEYHGKSGTYIPSKTGSFDAETGQYIPPKGLVLDSTKGFIISDRKSKGEKKKVLLALRSDLNKVIAQDIILADPEKDKKNTMISARVLSNRERFTKNMVSFTIRPYAETIDYTDSTNGSFELESSGGKAFEIDWEHNSTNRLQLATGFIAKMIDYKQDPKLIANSLDFPSDNLFSFYGGLKYYLGTRINLKSRLIFDQGHYVNFRTLNNALDPQLSRITVSKVTFGGELEAIRSNSGKYSLDISAEVMSNMLKTAGNLEISRGFGYDVDISIKYWPEVYWWLKLGFNTESMSNDFSGINYTATHTVSSSGFLISTGYAF